MAGFEVIMYGRFWVITEVSVPPTSPSPWPPDDEPVGHEPGGPARKAWKRGITAETAWLFSDALGTSPQFWMNLQAMYDLTKARPNRHVKRIAATG
jgi:hypothetical protein